MQITDHMFFLPVPCLLAWRHLKRIAYHVVQLTQGCTYCQRMQQALQSVCAATRIVIGSGFI